MRSKLHVVPVRKKVWPQTPVIPKVDLESMDIETLRRMIVITRRSGVLIAERPIGTLWHFVRALFAGS